MANTSCTSLNWNKHRDLSQMPDSFSRRVPIWKYRLKILITFIYKWPVITKDKVCVYTCLSNSPSRDCNRHTNLSKWQPWNRTCLLKLYANTSGTLHIPYAQQKGDDWIHVFPRIVFNHVLVRDFGNIMSLTLCVELWTLMQKDRWSYFQQDQMESSICHQVKILYILEIILWLYVFCHLEIIDIIRGRVADNLLISVNTIQQAVTKVSQKSNAAYLNDP